MCSTSELLINVKEPEVIWEAHGVGHLYVKQAFSIGKILFHFVDGKDKKSTIDCYMNIQRAKTLADKIYRYILSKELEKSREAAKTAGETYPKQVWTSPIGGGKDNHGDLVARTFNIAPGMKSGNDYKYGVITATQSAAVDQDGKTVPVRKTNENAGSFKTIRVAIESYDDLMDLYFGIMDATADYTKVRYSWENIRSSYEKSMEEPENAEESRKNEKPASNPIPKQSTTTEQKPAQQPQANVYSLDCVRKTMVAERSSSKGDFAMQVTNADKTSTFNIVFQKDEIQKLKSGLWENFCTGCEADDPLLSFTINCVEGTENGRKVYYFKGFVM